MAKTSTLLELMLFTLAALMLSQTIKCRHFSRYSLPMASKSSASGALSMVMVVVEAVFLPHQIPFSLALVSADFLHAQEHTLPNLPSNCLMDQLVELVEVFVS